MVRLVNRTIFACLTVRAYVEAGGVRNSNTLLGFQYRCFGSAIIERNPSFSTLNSDDINYFKGILGEKNVIQDEDMWTRWSWTSTKVRASFCCSLEPLRRLNFFVLSFRSLTFLESYVSIVIVTSCCVMCFFLFRSLRFLNTVIRDAWLLFPKAEILVLLVEVFMFLMK